MLPIDQRELILQRREEAMSCIHFGLYHAATLTACSGIEMLLKTLYEELIEELQTKDPARADDLQHYRGEMAGNPEEAGDWGLGRWITFYSENNIIGDLQNCFSYSLSAFRMDSLWNANTQWNKCKHDYLMASPATARDICSSFKAYLRETRHPTAEQDAEARTMGEFSKHWLEDWESEIIRWFVHNSSTPQSEVLKPLAKLLGLVVSLIHDANTPIELKSQFMVAANYVLSSVDLMPEDEFDVRGLVDDSAVLVLTLGWLLRERNLDAEHLRRHWQGDTDIINELARLESYIVANKDALFAAPHQEHGDNLIWATIGRIADEGPEALWKNYWKEAY